MSSRAPLGPIRSHLLAPLLVAALGCGGGGEGPAAPPEEDGPTVTVRLLGSLRFDPAEVTIAPGTTVRWINQNNLFHTVTPEGHDEWTRFRTSRAGETFEHTFGEPGEFPYFCEPHLAFDMVGKITVR